MLKDAEGGGVGKGPFGSADRYWELLAGFGGQTPGEDRGRFWSTSGAFDGEILAGRPRRESRDFKGTWILGGL